MTNTVMRVVPGPWLLRAPTPDLAAHRALRGRLPSLSMQELLELTGQSELRGRGGAAFPFSAKLAAAARTRARRHHVVVNLSEGEPASFKDLALSVHQPHLVLDGATLVAHALGASEIHLVMPTEHPEATRSIRHALQERRGEASTDELHWHLHTAASRFVAGESSAVTELIAGRPNLPVTSWAPSAVSGLHGQPTVLSNGETYAQVAALALTGPDVPGTTEEPGTRLLSIREPNGTARVVEAAHGTPWREILSAEERSGPILLGGYHGLWATAGQLDGLTVSHHEMAAAGLALGAGIVLPLPTDQCPLAFTAEVVNYLADESAGRCGPCFRGLPALADAVGALLRGAPRHPVDQLIDLVSGRGACAHPTGTARLVRSTLTAFADEVAAHAKQRCLADHGATHELLPLGLR